MTLVHDLPNITDALGGAPAEYARVSVSEHRVRISFKYDGEETLYRAAEYLYRDWLKIAFWGIWLVLRIQGEKIWHEVVREKWASLTKRLTPLRKT